MKNEKSKGAHISDSGWLGVVRAPLFDPKYATRYAKIRGCCSVLSVAPLPFEFQICTCWTYILNLTFEYSALESCPAYNSSCHGWCWIPPLLSLPPPPCGCIRCVQTYSRLFFAPLPSCYFAATYFLHASKRALRFIYSSTSSFV